MVEGIVSVLRAILAEAVLRFVITAVAADVRRLREPKYDVQLPGNVRRAPASHVFKQSPLKAAYLAVQNEVCNRHGGRPCAPV